MVPVNSVSMMEKRLRIMMGTIDHTPDISLTDENTAARPEAVRAWKEISEWVKAASVKRELSGCRFGFLGNTYNGMLDMYSDFTMVQAQTGAHIEILEMCDLDPSTAPFSVPAGFPAPPFPGSGC